MKTSPGAPGLAALVLVVASSAWGQEGAAPPAANPDAGVPAAYADAASREDDPAPHPVLPDRSERWPGTVVIVILSMFLAAALVGPIVWANAPEEVPPAHSHDEPPGASHHHGKSGTLSPEPGHGPIDHGHH